MNFLNFFSKVNSVTPEIFKEKATKNKDFILLDVRQPFEFQEYRLKQAKLIPLFKIFNKFNEKNKNKIIYVYCRSGKRSNLAARILKVKGYDNVYNITGGLNSILKK